MFQFSGNEISVPSSVNYSTDVIFVLFFSLTVLSVHNELDRLLPFKTLKTFITGYNMMHFKHLVLWLILCVSVMLNYEYPVT